MPAAEGVARPCIRALALRALPWPLQSARQSCCIRMGEAVAVAVAAKLSSLQGRTGQSGAGLGSILPSRHDGGALHGPHPPHRHSCPAALQRAHRRCAGTRAVPCCLAVGPRMGACAGFCTASVGGFQCCRAGMAVQRVGAGCRSPWEGTSPPPPCRPPCQQRRAAAGAGAALTYHQACAPVTQTPVTYKPPSCRTRPGCATALCCCSRCSSPCATTTRTCNAQATLTHILTRTHAGRDPSTQRHAAAGAGAGPHAQPFRAFVTHRHCYPTP